MRTDGIVREIKCHIHFVPDLCLPISKKSNKGSGCCSSSSNSSSRK